MATRKPGCLTAIAPATILLSRSNGAESIRNCYSLPKGHTVNRIVYIVGLIVIVIAILSFFGLR
jgi:hypothetical protein